MPDGAEGFKAKELSPRGGSYSRPVGRPIGSAERDGVDRGSKNPRRVNGGGLCCQSSELSAVVAAGSSWAWAGAAGAGFGGGVGSARKVAMPPPCTSQNEPIAA